MDRVKEKIINYVRDVRAIWDKEHPHHHNVHVLGKQWKTIAAKVGKPEKEVKTIWKNLRQEFGKQLRKCSRSEGAAPDEIVSNWPFYASMVFLADQFVPSAMAGKLECHEDDNSNAQEDPISDERDNTAFLPPDSPISVPSPEPLSEASASSSGFRQRKTPQTVIGEALISLEKRKLDLRRTKVAEPEDDNFLFLKSLLPQMKKLDPQRNMLFRTEMQGRLYNLLYGDPQEQTTQTSLQQPQYETEAKHQVSPKDFYKFKQYTTYN